ncbi:MAG: hypothetical protein WAV73_03755 [Candidatus Moraniibacteriota bacterium]
MRKMALLMVSIFVLAWASPAIAGNFWIGKIPEPGSGEAFFLQSMEAGKIWIGNIPASGSKEGAVVTNERNADPCGLLSKWGLVLDEWKDGGHGLSPAKIFVLAAEENDGNLAVLLVKAEISQRLISIGQRWNKDFEYRLLKIMSYGANQSNQCKWYGCAPNAIGESYQNALEESRGLTFEEAFLKSTDNQGDWLEFQELYAACAQFMNKQLGLNTTYSSQPSSSGYYHDFAVTPLNRDKYIAAVQLLFELTGSPLADKDLFKKSGSPSIINYDAPTFCQCQ